MAKTTTFSASASPTKTAITAQTWTRRIDISEDPSVSGYPTTDYLVYAPAQTDTPVRKLAGTMYTFHTDGAPFYANQIVGYVAGVSGSTTFQQIEEGLT